jgi:hypothetical protein
VALYSSTSDFDRSPPPVIVLSPEPLQASAATTGSLVDAPRRERARLLDNPPPWSAKSKASDTVSPGPAPVLEVDSSDSDGDSVTVLEPTTCRLPRQSLEEPPSHYPGLTSTPRSKETSRGIYQWRAATAPTPPLQPLDSPFQNSKPASRTARLQTPTKLTCLSAPHRTLVTRQGLEVYSATSSDFPSPPPSPRDPAPANQGQPSRTTPEAEADNPGGCQKPPATPSSGEPLGLP